MATAMKPRIAVILALTVTAAAVSSFTLLPRWRTALSASDQSIDSFSVLQLQAAVNEALWNPPAPRDYPEAKEKSVLFPQVNSNRQSGGAQTVPNETNFEFQRHMHDSGRSTREDDDIVSKLKKVPNTILEKAAIADYKAPVLSTASTTPSPINLKFSKTSSLSTPVKDLPSMKRGSVEIGPERLPSPAHSSDIYISLLTAAKFHDDRVSLLYLTWLQTFNPKQVHVVTDNDDNKWIQAFKKEGGNIHVPDCPQTAGKTRKMMCCKSGAQFDYWFRAREAGHNYKWYCHFDDDLYVNPQALVNLLSQHDPTTDQYLGNWAAVARRHKLDRLPGDFKLARNLFAYTERKRDDFRYANGPAYCISETLMMKVEKYLRGKRYEENCKKSAVYMDDLLPGVIIEGVLGVNLTDCRGFRSQMDNRLSVDSKEIRNMDLISVTIGRFSISDRRFDDETDIKEVFSYHCALHPEVSWCQRR